MRSAEVTEGSKPKATEAKVNIEEAKWGEDDDSLAALQQPSTVKKAPRQALRQSRAISSCLLPLALIPIRPS